MKYSRGLKHKPYSSIRLPDTFGPTSGLQERMARKLVEAGYGVDNEQALFVDNAKLLRDASGEIDLGV